MGGVMLAGKARPLQAESSSPSPPAIPTTGGITPDNEGGCLGFRAPGNPDEQFSYITVSSGIDRSCGIIIDNDNSVDGSEVHHEVQCWSDTEQQMGAEFSPPLVIATSAKPVTMTATLSNLDREQIILSDDGQIVLPAREAQTTLTAEVVEDDFKEPQIDYTIGP